MKTLKEQIAVMQAADEGKKIYVRRASSRAEFRIKPTHTPFDWGGFEYEVAREPRRVFVNFYTNTNCYGNGYADKDDARHAGAGDIHRELIEFVEVIKPE